MRMHNGNLPLWMERLSYFVSTMATNELATGGARASATTELALFSWYIPIPATKGVFTRGQFWPSGIVVACVCVCVSVCLSVCQSRVCPRDNSSLVQARITKFGAQMQNTLVKVPIVLWGDRPWPSRSNLTWKSNFTSFWACPDDNLSSVQARVTKLGPKMHRSTVKIPI